jgi:hypothetical protein
LAPFEGSRLCTLLSASAASRIFVSVVTFLAAALRRVDRDLSS